MVSHATVYYDPLGYGEDCSEWDEAADYDARKQGRIVNGLPPALRPKASGDRTADDERDLGAGMSGLVAMCKHVLTCDEMHINTTALDPSKRTDAFQAIDVLGSSLPRDLPIFTREHENQLLVQAHKVSLPSGRVTDMRRCLFEDQCIGMQTNFPGHTESGGIVLREALTPVELAQFEQTGALPEKRRPCILCSRKAMTMMFLMSESEQRLDGIRNRILNWYINPRDCEMGYRGEHMVPPEGSRGWHCMCGSVCMVVLHKMRIVQDEETSVWRVTQDELGWSPSANMSVPFEDRPRKRPRGVAPPPARSDQASLF